MAFTIHPSRRYLVQCAVTYNTGLSATPTRDYEYLLITKG